MDKRTAAAQFLGLEILKNSVKAITLTFSALQSIHFALEWQLLGFQVIERVEELTKKQLS
ncbi:MAG: hypothetical protein ACM37W_04585 [Actinomycetota bacterium]